MPKYAEKTEVSVEKSQEELRHILRNHGASQIGVFENFGKGHYGVFFRITESDIPLAVKLLVPAPDESEFAFTPTGKERSKETVQKAMDQEMKRKWHVLILLVKAKFETIDQGISTVKREFLSDIVLPDGRTVEQFLIPQIEHSYEKGSLPKLLSWMDEA